MTKIWVELLADHHKHGVKGAKVEIDESIGKALITTGDAKACEKPDDTISPEAKALGDMIQSKIATGLETIRVELKEETKSFNTAVTKSFGALHNPAEAKNTALEARYGFEDCNQFCLAVKQAGMPDGKRDERLFNAKAPSGMNTIIGEQGGFLVPTEMSNNIMEMVWQQSNLLARTDQHRLQGGSIELKALNETSRATGSRRGGVRAYWLDEAEQYTASKPKFRKLLLKPHKLGVFYYATDEQLSDTAGYNLEQKLTQYAGEEIAWMVDDAILNGDGVGKPLGIMNSAVKLAIAKESSPAQSGVTVVWQNFIKAYSRMLPSSIPRSIWLVNSDVLPSLYSMVGPKSDGTAMIYVSGDMYPTAAGAPFGTILGRPVVPCEQCATLGTEGDVIFGDFGWYATATKGGVNQAMSIHLRFDYGETAFRYDFRVDGQPWLNSPITPANGTATQSSFITFAVRA